MQNLYNYIDSYSYFVNKKEISDSEDRDLFLSDLINKLKSDDRCQTIQDIKNKIKNLNSKIFNFKNQLEFYDDQDQTLKQRLSNLLHIKEIKTLLKIVLLEKTTKTDLANKRLAALKKRFFDLQNRSIIYFPVNNSDIFSCFINKKVGKNSFEVCPFFKNKGHENVAFCKLHSKDDQDKSYKKYCTVAKVSPLDIKKYCTVAKVSPLDITLNQIIRPSFDITVTKKFGTDMSSKIHFSPKFCSKVKENFKNVISKVLKQFQYLILHNINHFDIKPENILYNNGIIHLIDFSIDSSYSLRYLPPDFVKADQNNASLKGDAKLSKIFEKNNDRDFYAMMLTGLHIFVINNYSEKVCNIFGKSLSKLEPHKFLEKVSTLDKNKTFKKDLLNIKNLFTKINNIWSELKNVKDNNKLSFKQTKLREIFLSFYNFQKRGDDFDKTDSFCRY